MPGKFLDTSFICQYQKYLNISVQGKKDIWLQSLNTHLVPPEKDFLG